MVTAVWSPRLQRRKGIERVFPGKGCLSLVPSWTGPTYVVLGVGFSLWKNPVTTATMVVTGPVDAIVSLTGWEVIESEDARVSQTFTWKQAMSYKQPKAPL
jgi:hypothetical protein